jgi:hypothetical protein
VLTYAATIPLSIRSLVYLFGLLAAHRQEIGSPWRQHRSSKRVATQPGSGARTGSAEYRKRVGQRSRLLPLLAVQPQPPGAEQDRRVIAPRLR